ncbi:hypothetical protein F1559_001212 [Cyanidiococcus yangmingshanensis]|uniref:Coenzyme Q-binding protein COQ10 START domain-containing protein n=1 Tax=Cyanidiococcus yangmingshanensis TaxID=2690220 RepID=A0A7J7ID36_9RHOD|nr:hypothetical protein F1559_001212 [Cyanidiococcus yangmingshanensis]
MFSTFCSGPKTGSYTGSACCDLSPGHAVPRLWRRSTRNVLAPLTARRQRLAGDSSYIACCAAEGGASEKAAPKEGEQSTWVAVKAAIVIEASRPFVYRMFADLGRVQEWSASLARVTRSETEPGLAEWKFSWQTVELEWVTRDTRIVPNQRIEWRSVSGLEHVGAVTFEDAKNSTFVNLESTVCTRVAMNIRYDAKSSLAAAVLRAGVVRNFVETAILMDLNRFREYCLRQQLFERRRMRNVRNQAGKSDNLI